MSEPVFVGGSNGRVYQVGENGERILVEQPVRKPVPAGTLQAVSNAPPVNAAELVQAVREDLPTVGTLMKNFVSSVFEIVSEGGHHVSKEVFAQRIEICSRCPRLYPEEFRCAECGCWMRVKATYAAMRCPQRKW